ncbi:hypothetical protein ACVYFC_16670 [Vibrio cholerae]|uniref:hypothetical protein n=1 Tax=Vibrio cholerae TaxID=666 RepID=UPI002934DFD0|nr:hypothetical protein [Vibrio cholerae]MDV2301170.1 hypothetical protein [Vibrio cholerae]
MSAKIYRANFECFVKYNKASFPDAFEINGRIQVPSDEFVVSRNKQGIPISRYGDDVWDFRFYRLAGDSGSARINFEFAQKSYRNEAKWLAFLLIYCAESSVNYGISIATIMNYMKSVRRLIGYASSQSRSIATLLSEKKHLDEFISTLETRTLLTGFSSLVGHLAHIPSDISGYKISSLYSSFLAREKSKELPVDFQHPVIPPRLLSSLISDLEMFLNEILASIDNLIGFTKNIIHDPLFARCDSKQRQLGVQRRAMAPFFYEASSIYGLGELLFKYSVSNIPGLSKFLTRIQHACRIYIHIYTGMRHSECLSLKNNALVIEKMMGRNVYKVFGDTSKFVGQKKRVAWVTSKEVVKAFEIAQKISILICSQCDILQDDAPLFISVSYLRFTGANIDLNAPLIIQKHANKDQEIFNFFPSEPYAIEDSDFEHLVAIDPFRTWHKEKAFQLGSVWRFTTHQLRRTLAFYVSQSANVSIPALKSQLKHISREMTLYYCNASACISEFDHDEHISHLMREIKPESDAHAYLAVVADRTEPLFGTYGRFVDRNVTERESEGLLLNDRKELVSRFKKGELAYKETPLGACMTTSPCDKKLLRLVSACISCDKAIIKTSKLERVIARQKVLVDELKSKDDSSIALRTELSELEDLESYQRRIALLKNKEV